MSRSSKFYRGICSILLLDCYNPLFMSHQLLPVSPSAASIHQLFEGLKEHAPEQRKLSVKARVKRLDALYAEVWRRRDDLKRAMWDDFQKPPQEVDLTEIFVLKQEIKAIKKD